jgi:hypothetical protein
LSLQNPTSTGRTSSATSALIRLCSLPLKDNRGRHE